MKLTEEDIKLIRDSRQEITLGELNTYDNLQNFVKSNLPGLKIGEFAIEIKNRDVKAATSYNSLINKILSKYKVK